MIHGLETVAHTERQEKELELAEMKKLRFSFGVTRLNKIKNEAICKMVHMRQLHDKLRELKLRWFGHVRESQRTM